MRHYFTHNGLTLGYFDNGGYGDPLVFQHGLTGDNGQIASSFLGDGRRVVTLECRGHGMSDMGPEEELGIATFADDVRALLRHLGVVRAAFAGISMGAAIAANYAARYGDEVTHLVMVRPSWHADRCPANMAAFGVVADFLDLYGERDGKEMFRRSGVCRELERTSPDNAGSLLAIFDKGDSKRMVALLRRLLTCDPGLDVDSLSRLRAPVQVHGTARDIIHPESLATRLAWEIKNAVYVELYPKSLDKKRHTHDLTQALLRCLRT